MSGPITKLIFLQFVIFVFGETPDNKTIASYDPNVLLSKIFNFNESAPRASYSSEQFLKDNNEYYDNLNRGNVKFNNEIYNNYYDISPDQNTSQEYVQFQDNNKDGLNKKRRRKRKQKQRPYGLLNQVVRPNIGFNGLPNPAFGGQYYGPPRPRPSIASEALSAVTEALTSIALNDDYQCVARLLCEAAGGGALGSSGILQTISGLQPLLTLLSAYNGISTNPLFVFGRAVFLGMSSNGNAASCRYAYSLCPTDPEQLVHYLNNHNGGFFRFFNSPQQHQGQQNVEQFYNQLSQNYGLYNNPPPQPPGYQGQQSYGFYNPKPQNNGYKPNLYSGYGQQNYGLAFPYNNNEVTFKKFESNKDVNEIQRRIQNKPIHINDSEDFNTKWTFPETIEHSRINYVNSDVFRGFNFDKENTVREVKALKFPDSYKDENKEDIDDDRNIRGFAFPGSQSNRQYNEYNNNYVQSNAYNNLYNKYNVNKNLNDNNDDDFRGVRTVYVVRGNGDPNKPEIVKLRPGEKIQ